MNQATQQNAALVEESAAAAASLKTQAEQLVQAVAVFRLAPGHQPAPAALATHAAQTVQVVKALPGPAEVERRSPQRATNVKRLHPVARPVAAAAPALRATPPKLRSGTDDWESF